MSLYSGVLNHKWTKESYYMFDLLVTHPELEIGDAWVSDKAESVEACVMNIINR